MSVTRESQNIAIAKMIWIYRKGKFNWEWLKPKSGETVPNYDPLLFDKDLYWQEEAINYIENQNFSLKLTSFVTEEGYGEGAVAHYCWFIKRKDNEIIESVGYNSKEGENRIETVFQALYEFSEYLKNKR
jgi:hypothetical protein